MDKKELLEMAQAYSKVAIFQENYLAGFQAACNIVRQKLENCYNGEFCDEMEELAQIAYMDLDSDD